MRPAKTEYIAARSISDALSRCSWGVGAVKGKWKLKYRIPTQLCDGIFAIDYVWVGNP